MKKANQMTNDELARYMDYSILKPEYTDDYIIELTKWGVKHNVRCICVNSVYTEMLEPYVRGSNSTIAPTIDFPFGNSTTPMRVMQIEEIGKLPYVKEIDIVANFGKIRSKKYDEVINDLKTCIDTAHKYNLIVKVIIETDALNEEEIKQGCECVIAAGGDYVKTSTGFLTGHELHGASNEVVELLIKQANGRIKVKGSGRVRTREHYLELIDLGVDRIGIGFSSAPTIFQLDEKL